jgi:drug/metabolite transporter (DMT)-like permease
MSDINQRSRPAAEPLVWGVACALGAGLAWGIVFVAPLVLADYPPAMLAFGRYLAFGLIALPLAWRDRVRLLALRPADWRAAFELALSGNITYYLCLAAAIQLADAPLPTMIIGTLPVVIAIVANLHEGGMPWLRLLPSLGVIAAGIMLVNQAELLALDGVRNLSDYLLGALAALGALLAWTWYPVRNSRWLRLHPELNSATWATAQGVATLPLAAVGMAGCLAWYSLKGGLAMPLGPRPWAFTGWMLAIGLSASWLGTLLWNRASQLLPTALVGQLIVFETLAALAYAFVWRGVFPGAEVLGGVALLVAGVVLGVRAFGRP